MSIDLTIDPLCPEEAPLAQALTILRRGGVLAFPTETFYGLGVDAMNEEAVAKVFQIKGRDFRNPLPVIIGDERNLYPLVKDIPEIAWTLMHHFWPGPLTLVLQASRSVSDRLTAGTGKIGIRISSHPLARRLAQDLGGPLTATSANLSGGEECTLLSAVREALSDLPDGMIDGGKTPGGAGSTILDMTVSPPRILREGAIPRTLVEHLTLR